MYLHYWLLRKLPTPVLGRLPQVLLHFISQNLRNDGLGRALYPKSNVFSPHVQFESVITRSARRAQRGNLLALGRMHNSRPVGSTQTSGTDIGEIATGFASFHFAKPSQ